MPSTSLGSLAVLVLPGSLYHRENVIVILLIILSTAGYACVHVIQRRNVHRKTRERKLRLLGVQQQQPHSQHQDSSSSPSRTTQQQRERASLSVILLLKVKFIVDGLLERSASIPNAQAIQTPPSQPPSSSTGSMPSRGSAKRRTTSSGNGNANASPSTGVKEINGRVSLQLPSQEEDAGRIASLGTSAPQTSGTSPSGKSGAKSVSPNPNSRTSTPRKPSPSIPKRSPSLAPTLSPLLQPVKKPRSIAVQVPSEPASPVAQSLEGPANGTLQNKNEAEKAAIEDACNTPQRESKPAASQSPQNDTGVLPVASPMHESPLVLDSPTPSTSTPARPSRKARASSRREASRASVPGLIAGTSSPSTADVSPSRSVKALDEESPHSRQQPTFQSSGSSHSGATSPAVSRDPSVSGRSASLSVSTDASSSIVTSTTDSNSHTGGERIRDARTRDGSPSTSVGSPTPGHLAKDDERKTGTEQQGTPSTSTPSYCFHTGFQAAESAHAQQESVSATPMAPNATARPSLREQQRYLPTPPDSAQKERKTEAAPEFPTLNRRHSQVQESVPPFSPTASSSYSSTSGPSDAHARLLQKHAYLNSRQAYDLADSQRMNQYQQMLQQQQQHLHPHLLGQAPRPEEQHLYYSRNQYLEPQTPSLASSSRSTSPLPPIFPPTYPTNGDGGPLYQSEIVNQVRLMQAQLQYASQQTQAQMQYLAKQHSAAPSVPPDFTRTGQDPTQAMQMPTASLSPAPSAMHPQHRPMPDGRQTIASRTSPNTLSLQHISNAHSSSHQQASPLPSPFDTQMPTPSPLMHSQDPRQPFYAALASPAGYPISQLSPMVAYQASPYSDGGIAYPVHEYERSGSLPHTPDLHSSGGLSNARRRQSLGTFLHSSVDANGSPTPASLAYGFDKANGGRRRKERKFSGRGNRLSSFAQLERDEQSPTTMNGEFQSVGSPTSTYSTPHLRRSTHAGSRRRDSLAPPSLGNGSMTDFDDSAEHEAIQKEVDALAAEEQQVEAADVSPDFLRERLKKMEAVLERRGKELEIARWRLRCVEGDRRQADLENQKAIMHFHERAERAEARLRLYDNGSTSTGAPPTPVTAHRDISSAETASQEASEGSTKEEGEIAEFPAAETSTEAARNGSVQTSSEQAHRPALSLDTASASTSGEAVDLDRSATSPPHSVNSLPDHLANPMHPAYNAYGSLPPAPYQHYHAPSTYAAQFALESAAASYGRPLRVNSKRGKKKRHSQPSDGTPRSPLQRRESGKRHSLTPNGGGNSRRKSFGGSSGSGQDADVELERERQLERRKTQGDDEEDTDEDDDLEIVLESSSSRSPVIMPSMLGTNGDLTIPSFLLDSSSSSSGTEEAQAMIRSLSSRSESANNRGLGMLVASPKPAILLPDAPTEVATSANTASQSVSSSHHNAEETLKDRLPAYVGSLPKFKFEMSPPSPTKPAHPIKITTSTE